MLVLFYRGTKESLENKILKKYEIAVEKEPEDEGKSRKELLGVKRKYKIGDGIHTYKELEYEKGEIPIAFYANRRYIHMI